jgi:predicted SnoaL-like aldol condensation-catalyzing enzyme
MDADGKVIEHWDVLQEIGDPKNAAHANGMF